MIGSLNERIKKSPPPLLRPLQILRNYDPKLIRTDAIAGLSIAVMLIPQSIAYALIADLPPQMGLFSGLVGAIVGSFWGSSNHLQTGPTNTISLLTLATLLTVATPGTESYFAAAGMIALMAGVACLVLGLGRLGALVNFISDSVVIGFSSGVGILIFVNQLRVLGRLDIPSSPSMFSTLQDVIAHLDAIHWLTVYIGLGTILLILLMHRFTPRLPGTFAGIVAAGAIVAFLGLKQEGVLVIGEIPRQLPPIANLPIFDWNLIGQLSAGALAVTALGLVEATSISRTIGSQSGQRTDNNQEFIGQGLANIAAGIFSGFAVAGSFSRSTVNYRSGGNSAMVGLFTGSFLLIAMFLFAPQAAFIPRASLAGVLIVIALRLINTKEIIRVWKTGRGDRIIMVVTLVAMLFLPLEFAVLSGILISLAYYLLRTSVPKVYPVIPDEKFTHLVPKGLNDCCPQLVIFDILGDFYFGSANHIEQIIQKYLEENPVERYLLLRMNNVVLCDVSGINSLNSLMRSMRKRKGDLFLVNVYESVLDFMRTSGFQDDLGSDHILSNDMAIQHLFYKILDPAICIYECEERIFEECQNLPKRTFSKGELMQIDSPPGLIPTVSAQNLWDSLHSNHPPVVIDVREPREFQLNRIPGSRIFPLPKLLTEYQELPKDEEIVLVCRSGRRSPRAARFLDSKGFKNVSYLSGGLISWEAAGLLSAVELSKVGINE